MDADILNGKHYSLSELARMVGGVDPSTLWRWTTKGVGPHKVKLRTHRIGGRVRVFKRDLDAFLANLNAPTAPVEITPKLTAEQRRAAKKAGRQLESMGV